MTLTQGLIFVATMLVLFGGLFYTIWVFRKEQSGQAPLKARVRGAGSGGVEKFDGR